MRRSLPQLEGALKGPRRGSTLHILSKLRAICECRHLLCFEMEKSFGEIAGYSDGHGAYHVSSLHWEGSDPYASLPTNACLMSLHSTYTC